MPRTLLVIDDNASVRQSLRFLLLRRGYRVLVAEDGPAGVAAAGENEVDGVLLDVNMPGMNGIAVCRELVRQAQRQGRVLPVWMMTGARTSELAKAASEAGALVLLAKPFDFQALYAMLEEKLGPPELPTTDPW
jgi:DNA-binding response OmpR family regulator